jgi:hypothetical protein
LCRMGEVGHCMYPGGDASSVVRFGAEWGVYFSSASSFTLDSRSLNDTIGTARAIWSASEVLVFHKGRIS